MLSAGKAFRRNLSISDNRILNNIYYIIADPVVAVGTAAQELNGKDINFFQGAQAGLKRLSHAVSDIMERIMPPVTAGGIFHICPDPFINCTGVVLWVTG